MPDFKRVLRFFTDAILKGVAADVPNFDDAVAELDSCLTFKLGAKLRTEKGIRPSAIEWFNTVTGDPDIDLPVWLRDGAPMGIAKPITTRGIFPLVEAPETAK